MPTRPDVKVLTNSSVDVLNAIRNSASTNYRDYVPIATADAESIKTIGAIIMDFPELQNEFLSALINRIGRVLITSKMYSNPWQRFKRGYLEMGESVEEVFVDIAKPFQFDPATAETDIFKREKPNVKSAFHIMNYQKYYKATIQREQLRTAFLSWGGISDLIARIVDAMYTGANYDEFITMKYLIARHILDGHFKVVTIPTVEAANMKAIAAQLKATSNEIEFLNREYNPVGVAQHTEKRNQYLIRNASFDAVMDVEVLASAFNMNKAEFLGNSILVDSFGNLDKERLALLFADDPTFTIPTDAQLAALDNIPAILIDENWFMVFDNLNEFTEQYNGEGLYWNYWYHQWKTFSISPFSQAAVFAAGTPAISSVTVTPTAVTASEGQSVQFSAAVVSNYFASKAVTWSANSDDVTITNSGLATIKQGATSGAVTITATSVFDSTKKDTATLTIA